MQSLTLPIELVNRILGYLSRQPYHEVAGMIAEVQRAATAATTPSSVPEKKANGQQPQAQTDAS